MAAEMPLADHIRKARELRMRYEVHKVHLDKLDEACEAGNIDRINELFETTSLKPADASSQLTAAPYVQGDGFSLVVVRCLLDHGADAKKMQMYSLANCCSLELFKLPAERGIDFKSEGHNIIE